MGFVYLAIAVSFEVAATTLLKTTESFTRLWPSVIVLLCVCTSLYFFSLSIRTLNIAIVYSIWSGAGITLVSLLAWKIHGQQIDLPAALGIALIIAGVLVINLCSTTVRLPANEVATTAKVSIPTNQPTDHTD